MSGRYNRSSRSRSRRRRYSRSRSRDYHKSPRYVDRDHYNTNRHFDRYEHNDYRESRRDRRRDNKDMRGNIDYHYKPRSYEPLKTRWDEQPKAVDSVELQQQLNVHQEKAAKRLYVGNINTTTSERDIIDAFNDAMRRGDYINKNDVGDVITSVQVNYEKSYAFVEFRSIDEAVKALSLDGFPIKGASVKVRRPKDFNPVIPFISGLAKLMEPGTTQPRESILYMGNIPLQMTDEEIRKRLENLNPLKHFFVNVTLYLNIKTQNLKKKLNLFNGITLSGSLIDVCSGIDGFKHFPNAALSSLHSAMFPTTTDLVIATILNSSVGYNTVFEKVLHVNDDVENYNATRVIVIFNMINPVDLKSEQRYNELIDDLREVSREYGNAISISVPRPTDDLKNPNGLGRVFIEFENVEMAKRAWSGFSHKRYCNRSLLVAFYSEEKYNNRSFGYVEEEKDDVENDDSMSQ
ncbi:U2 snRNP auxiliary factor large subunit [Entamoeba marina]